VVEKYRQYRAALGSIDAARAYYLMQQVGLITSLTYSLRDQKPRKRSVFEAF